MFISIKPSLRRWSSIHKIRSANAMIREYCAKHEGLTYVNIEPQMLGPAGKPRPELLAEDGLHLTPGGYKIWTTALEPYLKQVD